MAMIPGKDDAFLAWSANLIAVSKAHKAAWMLPEAPLADLETLHAAFAAALAKTKDPNRGKIDTLLKNTTRAALESAERHFINSYIRHNDNIPEEWKVEAGIPLHDDEPTATGEPKSRPEFWLRVLDILRIRIDFRDMGSASAARPAGLIGAMLFYAVSDAPITDYTKLTQFKLLTDTPATLELPPDCRGKVLSCAMRWQAQSGGVLGPWSDIQSIIIP